MSLALFTFRATPTKEGFTINVLRMKRDTPFQQGVFSIKTPDFKDFACLASRLCSQRRSRAMEPSCRRKKRKTGVSHPFAFVLNMLSAISSGIGIIHDIIRFSCSEFRDMVMETCCGLHNFRIWLKRKKQSENQNKS